jgi:type IV pilus assembly protein PilV
MNETLMNARQLRINNRGFTLIEVMVAVLVLSIGLLGVAGMQISSLKGGNDALVRAQAVLGAEDILDRMRANRQACLAGNYNIGFADASSGTGMVLADLTEWKKSLTSNLPSGEGSVAVAGGVATVVVRWTDSYKKEFKNQVEMVTRL